MSKFACSFSLTFASLCGLGLTHAKAALSRSSDGFVIGHGVIVKRIHLHRQQRLSRRRGRVRCRNYQGARHDGRKRGSSRNRREEGYYR